MSACNIFSSNAGTIAETCVLNCVEELYNASDVTAPESAPSPISRVLDDNKRLEGLRNTFDRPIPFFVVVLFGFQKTHTSEATHCRYIVPG